MPELYDRIADLERTVNRLEEEIEQLRLSHNETAQLVAQLNVRAPLYDIADPKQKKCRCGQWDKFDCGHCNEEELVIRGGVSMATDDASGINLRLPGSVGVRVKYEDVVAWLKSMERKID